MTRASEDKRHSGTAIGSARDIPVRRSRDRDPVTVLAERGAHPRITDHGSRITLLALTSAPTAALAQSAATPGPSVLPMIVALAFVLALIPLAVWVMKKLGGSQPALAQAAGLKVVTQLPLGARERVVVLEAGDRWLLLGVTAAAINRIGTLPKPAGDTPAAAPPATAFGHLLQQIRAGR